MLKHKSQTECYLNKKGLSQDQRIVVCFICWRQITSTFTLRGSDGFCTRRSHCPTPTRRKISAPQVPRAVQVCEWWNDGLCAFKNGMPTSDGVRSQMTSDNDDIFIILSHLIWNCGKGGVRSTGFPLFCAWMAASRSSNGLPCSLLRPALLSPPPVALIGF